jgi:hypothetical protein
MKHLPLGSRKGNAIGVQDERYLLGVVQYTYPGQDFLTDLESPTRQQRQPQ